MSARECPAEFGKFRGITRSAIEGVAFRSREGTNNCAGQMRGGEKNVGDANSGST